MLDQPNLSPVHQDAIGATEEVNDVHRGETLLTILWRFKWLLLVLLPLGATLGYLINRQKPTTYRATTQLMFKSNTPLSLDAATGVVLGGIPSGDLMQSLITSDAIVERVKSNDQLRNIPSLASMNDAKIIALVRKGIRFQTITDRNDSRDRMIASLSFEGQDPQVCIAAVNAVNLAIGAHFKEERESTVNEFGKLINDAQRRLLPQQAELEQQYQEFRDQAPLEWDSEGHAINPHRERQALFQKLQIELQQKVRDLESELRFATSTRDRHDSPLMVAMIIGQLSQVVGESELSQQSDSLSGPIRDDLQIRKIEVEKALVPLQIQREQLENVYGASHPEVQAIATRIDGSQRKLNQLNEQLVVRRLEIESSEDVIDYGEQAKTAQIARAVESVEAYIRGLSERLRIANSDLDAINTNIAIEKRAGDELKKAEDEDASYRRQIASVQGMLIQLEQQLSALKLVDISGGILVKTLLHTSRAGVTGPNLNQDVVVYSMVGFGVAVLLAILLNASEKTYRSAEEIQQGLKLPVLTHIPLDESRNQKVKPILDPAATRLDPKMAVVHRPYSPAAEAVRGVRTAMLLDKRQSGSKVYQITSPLPGDGKSTLAANVGCSIAQSGKRTLLIDLDLRSPRLSLRFGLETKIGLANVINGELEIRNAVHKTPIDNLDVLPCGPLPSNPAEALTLPELNEIFQWARANYDFVIVDTPPLLMVSDPAIVTTYVDAAILVMRIRRRCRPNAKEAVGMLRWSGARVMGVVVNKINTASRVTAYKSSASGSYQSIGYGYGDKYRRRYQQEVNAQDTYVITGNQSTRRVDAVDSPDASDSPRPHLKPKTSPAPTTGMKRPGEDHGHSSTHA